MPQINLLPWREQARQAKILQFASTVMLAIVVGILFVVFAHIHYKNVMAVQKKRGAYLNGELDQKHNELQALRKKKQEQVVLTEQLHFIMSLREESFEAVRLLADVEKAVPKTISLEKIKREGKNLIIVGKARSDLQITLFMKNIANISGFDQPVLSQITTEKDSGEEMRSFQLSVARKDKMHDKD